MFRSGQHYVQIFARNCSQSDVTVIRDGKKQGTYADIAITSAMSAGNAFIGHAKGMAVSAALYVDGKQVNKKTFTATLPAACLALIKALAPS